MSYVDRIYAPNARAEFACSGCQVYFQIGGPFVKTSTTVWVQEEPKFCPLCGSGVTAMRFRKVCKTCGFIDNGYSTYCVRCGTLLE